MERAPSPRFVGGARWTVALLTGALLGALVLGVGGRLARRGITLWEGRARQWTLGGSLTVIAYGAIFGTTAAALRLALDAAFSRWAGGASSLARASAFALACLVAAVVFLTSLSVHRLVRFPPVVVCFVAAYELAWRRLVRPYGAARPGHSVHAAGWRTSPTPCQR